MEPPLGLTSQERAVWEALAADAAAQGTLVHQTRWAFVDLCRARVGLDLFRAKVEAGELDTPIAPRYIAMMGRVDAAMLRFRLAPLGKPMAVPDAPPVDPFSQFESVN